MQALCKACLLNVPLCVTCGQAIKGIADHIEAEQAGGLVVQHQDTDDTAAAGGTVGAGRGGKRLSVAGGC